MNGLKNQRSALRSCPTAKRSRSDHDPTTAEIVAVGVLLRGDLDTDTSPAFLVRCGVVS